MPTYLDWLDENVLSSIYKMVRLSYHNERYDKVIEDIKYFKYLIKINKNKNIYKSSIKSFIKMLPQFDVNKHAFFKYMITIVKYITNRYPNIRIIHSIHMPLFESSTYYYIYACCILNDNSLFRVLLTADDILKDINVKKIN